MERKENEGKNAEQIGDHARENQDKLTRGRHPDHTRVMRQTRH